PPSNSPTPSRTAAANTGTPTPKASPTSTMPNLATPTQAVQPTVTQSPACIGDCNSDSEATVDELLNLVNIALGNASISNCKAGDGNGDGEITIDEILATVNKALAGC